MIMVLSVQWRFVAVGLAALLVLFSLNYVFTPALVGEDRLEEFFRPRGEMAFDSPTWRESSIAAGKRYEMTDDLLDSGRLIGLTETQVKVLLGEPNSMGDEDDERVLVYHLAKQRDYPAKSLWFPRFFPNHEAWMLAVRVRNGSAQSAKVFFN